MSAWLNSRAWLEIMLGRISKISLRYFLIYLIPVLFFGWAIRYIATHPEDFSKVLLLTLPVMILLCISQLLSIWVTSLLTSVMVKPYGVHLRFHEYFGITTVARSLNLLLPMKGGAGVRALYLKSQHQLPVADFVGMFAGQTVLTLFVASVMCLLGLGWIYFETGIYDIIGTLFFGCIGVLFGALVFWSPSLRPSDNSLLNVAKRILDSWHKLRSDRAIVVKICLISIANNLLSAFSIGILFWALQSPQPAGVAVYLGGGQDIMYLASFTPGALGIVEASTVFLSKNLYVNISDALLVALINRATIFLTSGLLTPWFLHLLLGSKVRQLFSTDRQ